MLFHDTDAAKSFHSAAMHCDVLAERAAQIELKQQVQRIHLHHCILKPFLYAPLCAPRFFDANGDLPPSVVWY